MFDALVTLPALLIDKDDRRRELYGKAGSFRFKTFGVECRALSNFWIHSDELISWVFEQTHKAVTLVLEGHAELILNEFEESIQRVINTNNKEEATELVSKIQSKIQQLIKI